MGKKYVVELGCYVEGNGYSYTETFDTLDEFCTAEEYVESLEPPLTPRNGEILEVRIYEVDTDDEYEEDKLLSEYQIC